MISVKLQCHPRLESNWDAMFVQALLGWTTLCKHLDITEGSHYSYVFLCMYVCMYEFVCVYIHACVQIHSEQTDKLLKRRHEGEREGKKTLLSTPAPWWQFAETPLSARGTLQLSYSS